MADKTEHTITQKSVDAFVAKLQAWALDLPIEEKAILAKMLTRAEEAPEVEGFMGSMSLTPRVVGRAVARSRVGDIADSLSPEERAKGWVQLWGQTIPK